MQKINTVTPDKHNYLQILNSIDKSINRLYFIGELPKERVTSVAIVGSRKPTHYGQEVAHRLAYELARRGVVIISGLALGLDAVAHKGALEAKGTALAVLAGGLDYLHPVSNRQLAEGILENGGAILSEYAPGVSPHKSHFIARNRIVSGLADALIVVEAAVRSGTLHTAGFAAEQGKEVFAVPGNITSPLSVGCNQLIKQGATPISSIDDFMKDFFPDTSPKQALLALADNPEEEAILALMRGGERDGTALQQQSGLSAAEFSQTLTMLEIKGTIRALGANQWSL
jgi:DNA processing protein